LQAECGRAAGGGGGGGSGKARNVVGRTASLAFRSSVLLQDGHRKLKKVKLLAKLVNETHFYLGLSEN
jgi:hypothetical protein